MGSEQHAASAATRTCLQILLRQVFSFHAAQEPWSMIQRWHQMNPNPCIPVHLGSTKTTTPYADGIAG